VEEGMKDAKNYMEGKSEQATEMVSARGRGGGRIGGRVGRRRCVSVFFLDTRLLG
jgi:hypothetical protein